MAELIRVHGPLLEGWFGEVTLREVANNMGPTPKRWLSGHVTRFGHSLESILDSNFQFFMLHYDTKYAFKSPVALAIYTT
jgi:hypothetical protein